LSRQSFVKGAAVLAAAGFSARFIGAFFRIVLAMLIGDEGVGLFQMAYPVYSALLAVSTAGIPLAISKLVSESLAKGNYASAHRIFRVALLMLAVSGFVFSLGMYLGAPTFAGLVARDPRASLALAAISPAIFFVTVMSAYRGFFQGQQQMMPTAVSQIIEQLARVAVALLLVVLLLPYGLAQAAAGASFGAVAGAFFGLACLMLIWQKRRREFLQQCGRCRNDGISTPDVMRRIIALALPITVGSLVMPLVSLVDLSVVPLRLHQAGFDTARATSLYGQLTGMATPLVHIPTIITVALAASLVPAISEALALQKRRLVQERAFLAVKITLLLGLPAAAGLYLLAGPITVLLFDNAEAGAVLAMMAVSVIFLTLYQTTAGILQGLGRTAEPVVNLLGGALVKLVLTWILTVQPAWHIQGAALATVAGFAVAALLNLHKVIAFTGLPLRPVDTLVKPGLATLGMSIVLPLSLGWLEAGFGSVGIGRAGELATLFSVVVGVAVYAALLLLLGVVRRADLEMVPLLGSRVAAVAEKLRLLRR
jgi:stage V sporulation protein B